MTILQHYRINYVYLLDLSPKNNINPEQIFHQVLFKIKTQAQSSMIEKQNIHSQKTGTCTIGDAI